MLDIDVLIGTGQRSCEIAFEPPHEALISASVDGVEYDQAVLLLRFQEIKRGEHGRTTSVPSVSSVREKTGLSQLKFATLLGVSVRTLQEWEQGRRAPSGPARTLLSIAHKNPKALLESAA